jgi:hypothetical protein
VDARGERASPREQVDHAFRSLVLPGVANVLELEIDLPTSL